MNLFDRSQHVYTSPDFDEIIKDTIRFFNGTPVYPLPVPERFHGTGIYALYCIAKSGIYSRFHTMNRTAFNIPIYVGKAVPKGWRQARQTSSETRSYELNSRLNEHSRSIDQSQDLDKADFGYLEKYRFFWEWQRDLKGSSLLKAAKWQLGTSKNAENAIS